MKLQGVHYAVSRSKCREIQNISPCNIINKTAEKYLHSLCSKCRVMRNFSLCNIIDKTAAKYFTVNDETTGCSYKAISM